MNYIAVLPTCTLYLEVVQTDQQVHDNVFIANDIERVFTTYKDATFEGAVTDNTSANKKAWEVLRDKYPSRFFQSYTTHGLRLLVREIFCAWETMKVGSTEMTYPDDYPFEKMLLLINECQAIVKFFHIYHVAKAQLQEMQNATGAQAPVRLCPMRWGTIQQTCKTLLGSEQHLHAIESARDVIQESAAQIQERQDDMDTIIDTAFVALLKKATAILEPIDDLTTKYQSDKVLISELLPDFYKLPAQFAKLLSNRVIKNQEFAYQCKKSKFYFQFMSGNAHGSSYMLG